MKKLLLILVVLVVLGAGGLLLFGLNPIVARLQPELLKIASGYLKQPVTAGSIHVSVLPQIAIDLSDLSVGAAAEPAGNIPKLKLKTSIGKLLSTPVGVSGITVDDPEIKITRRADGSLALGEYVFAAAAPKEAGKQTAAPAKLPGSVSVPEKQQSSQVAFNLTDGAIENGKIHLIDLAATPNQTITISNLNLSISNFGAGAAPFSLSAGLFGEKNISLGGTVDMGKVSGGVPETSAKLKIASLNLAEALKTAAAYGVKLPLELKNSLALDASYSNSGGKTAGDVELDLTQTGIDYPPYIKKEPSVPLKLALSGAGNPPSAVDSAQAKISADGSAITLIYSAAPANPSAGSLSIKSDDFKFASLKRVLAGTESYGLEGALKLDISIPKFNKDSKELPAEIAGSVGFADVSAAVPLSAGADGKSAAKVLPITALNGEIKFEGSKVTAKGLTLNAAGQPLEIGASASGLPEPDSAFYLKSAKVELEPLAKAALDQPPPALNGAYLDNPKISGSYSAAKKTGAVNIEFSGGSAAGLPLGAAKSAIEFSPGLTEFKPSELVLFGGQAKFSGSIRGETQKSLDFGLSGSGFQLEPITKFGAPDRSIYLKGAVNSITVRASSANMSDSNALRAAIQLTTGKGSIEGINIIGSTLGKVGQIPGLGLGLDALIPEEHRWILSGNSTPFEQLTADVSIAGATTSIKSAELAHQLYLITGGGTVTGGDFDLDLQLRLTPALTSKMVERERHLKLLLDIGENLQIPVRITRHDGITLVYPDVSRLAKGAVINTTKEVVGKTLDKIAPGLGGAKDTLDRLFK